MDTSNRILNYNLTSHSLIPGVLKGQLPKERGSDRTQPPPICKNKGFRQDSTSTHLQKHGVLIGLNLHPSGQHVLLEHLTSVCPTSSNGLLQELPTTTFWWVLLTTTQNFEFMIQNGSVQCDQLPLDFGNWSLAKILAKICKSNNDELGIVLKGIVNITKHVYRLSKTATKMSTACLWYYISALLPSMGLNCNTTLNLQTRVELFFFYHVFLILDNSFKIYDRLIQKV